MCQHTVLHLRLLLAFDLTSKHCDTNCNAASNRFPWHQIDITKIYMQKRGVLSVRFFFFLEVILKGFLKRFSLPVEQQLISHLSSVRCPDYILFEHTLFQVKLINLFITWAVSLPNHRVRNESANRTARGAFVEEGKVFLCKLLWKCIFNWICEASNTRIVRLPQISIIRTWLIT